MKTVPLAVVTLLTMQLAANFAEAQPANANYDEAKVPKFDLPDPLVLENGQRVTDVETWKQQRRPELLKLFESHVYGRSPGRPAAMRFKVTSSEEALDGKAIRKQVTVYFTSANNGPQMDILLYLPKDAKRAVPAFLGLNFTGNQSIHSDPGIKMSTAWMRNNKEKGIENNRATEASRGASSSRWPVEKILDRGFALATIYYGDIDPDFHDEFRN